MVLAQQRNLIYIYKHCFEFPSHYGSRSTRTRAGDNGSRGFVSIPLWFSLNDRRSPHVGQEIQFPSHYGSRSTKAITPAQTLLSVSIPLWFSLNKPSTEETRLQAKCFHPTMVLAQLAVEMAKRQLYSMFPSHYGSRSTKKLS